jgi:hypothetical protein
MWYVHYNLKGVAGLIAVSTLPLSIKKACELISRGAEVTQIDGSGGLKGLNAAEIKTRCAERERFGHRKDSK